MLRVRRGDDEGVVYQDGATTIMATGGTRVRRGGWCHDGKRGLRVVVWRRNFGVSFRLLTGNVTLTKYTVKTKYTLVTNVKPNVNRNGTMTGTLRTVKHRPRYGNSIASAVLLKYTVTRAANVCNFMANLLLVFITPNVFVGFLD